LFRTVLQSLRLPGHVRGRREVNFNYPLPEVCLRRLEGATMLKKPHIAKLCDNWSIYVPQMFIFHCAAEINQSRKAE
jgi:hypothetical protein